MHKTTKKYLNLGNFTNIDFFFLKEKITDSNRSVMKTNKHAYMLGPIKTICLLQTSFDAWTRRCRLMPGFLVVVVVLSENLFRHSTNFFTIIFSFCGLHVNCYLCCFYLSSFHACLLVQN